MIKGTAIQQRDLISVPQINYRKLDALNSSMIRLFDTDPIKFYDQFKLGKKRKDSKNPSLIIGDIVDFYLLDCKANEDEFNNRFDEKFALFTGTKGSGQVFILADTLFDVTQSYLDENDQITVSFESRFTEAVQKVQAEGKYKGKSEGKILEDFYDNGMLYFQSLLDNIGKTVIDVSILDKSKKVADMLLQDEFTKDVFEDAERDIEIVPKFPVEWIYTTLSGKKIDCKSEIDILRIDHHDKIVYIKDLKTTYDNEGFEYGYIKHSYYLQAAFYYLAIQYWMRENSDMKDYILSGEIEFIVGDTSSNNRRPIRYKMTNIDLVAGLNGFKLKGNSYRGIAELIEEISWCEDNNIWNCSKKVYDNKGILQLNIDYGH